MPQFLKDTLERAVKTFVQVFLASVPVGGALFDLDVSVVRGIAISALGAAISVVMSAASKRFGNHDDASLVSGPTP